MSKRGHVLHTQLAEKQARFALRRLPFPTAIVGGREEWTSFVPVDAGTVNWEEQHRILEAAVVEVWFDEDSGVELRWWRPGTTEDRFAVHFGEAFHPGEQEEIFLGIAGPLEDAQVAAVRKLIALPIDERDDQLRRHALEKKVGLPVPRRLPMADANLDSLREDFPKLISIDPAGRSRAKAKAAPATGLHVPRGRLFHVRRGLPAAREAFSRMKGRFAILGSSRSWTSFFPLTPAFDVTRATTFGELLADILEIIVDDETGFHARVHLKGGNYGGDLQVAWGRPFEEEGKQRVFFHSVGEHLSETKALALRDSFHLPLAERDHWLRSRGFERALGLPVLEPVPQATPIELSKRVEGGFLVSLPPYEPADAAELRRFGLLVEQVGLG